ncbi:hypothetical protein P389DRAFT_170715 [Cystobasidium minutum MCA 4210]|uniref:uncharacterized protein n=1 Tax=Cystobasidium minutum MCA 4210 TaxID=1397322 RepID=UPI0034CE2832|eukprot:jgi/Rhomi1/170715/fgenesh1_kg.4_\
MASEGWGNSGGGEGARLAFCNARVRQSLSGASLYSRSLILLSSMLVSHASTTRHVAAAALASPSLLALRPYSSRPAPHRRRSFDRNDTRPSYGRARLPLQQADNNWGGNATQSWGGGDGGYQAGGYGGGQRSTACFNCGQEVSDTSSSPSHTSLPLSYIAVSRAGKQLRCCSMSVREEMHEYDEDSEREKSEEHAIHSAFHTQILRGGAVLAAKRRRWRCPGFSTE